MRRPSSLPATTNVDLPHANDIYADNVATPYKIRGGNVERGSQP
jgi:hypothetical protein